MRTIHCILAKKCKDCTRMKAYIDKAINVCGQSFEIHEMDSESDEAIDFAIENGIEDIPACVIGDDIYFGKRGFTYDKIFNSINKL